MPHVMQTIGALILSLLLLDGPAAAAGPDDPEAIRSTPPDVTPYARGAVPEEAGLLGRGAVLSGAIPPQFRDVQLVDVVVNNTDPTLAFTDTFNDGETSIAINPHNPEDIVISAFSGLVQGNAPLWHSLDGGFTWTKEPSVPPAPGIPLIFGCGGPCDQTYDSGREDRLSGAILSSETNVYSGTTTNPADTADWLWFAPGNVTQRTNQVGQNAADQPWLLVNRDPINPDQDNIYVAYDDFSGAPDMRVAVAQGTDPPVFILDQRTGFSTAFINPGHRLADDQRRGIMYSLFQRRIAPGAGGSQNIDYMLNRSIDGGRSWSLNGSATGIIVANADSTQPQPKFCTVNALLGGVLHAAVDQESGDLFYVYGHRDPVTGNNRLALRRIVDDGEGGVRIGPEAFVTGPVQAALPAVAVTSDGTVGVFYYTCEGFSADGYPTFTAHVSLSEDQGQTFSDLELLTFLSSAGPSPDARQRVLGDYMQMKALGNTFYGAFTGNGFPFGRPFANH